MYIMGFSGELRRKYIYAFMQRIFNIENSVIAAFMSYSNILCDRLWTHWYTTVSLIVCLLTLYNATAQYLYLFSSIIIYFLGHILSDVILYECMHDVYTSMGTVGLQ